MIVIDPTATRVAIRMTGTIHDLLSNNEECSGSEISGSSRIRCTGAETTKNKAGLPGRSGNHSLPPVLLGHFQGPDLQVTVQCELHQITGPL